MLPALVKDPLATLDYTINWSEWLQPSETISSVVWTVQTGITQTSTSFTNTTATIWLSGGTVDTTYSIECQITTNQSRVDARQLLITVSVR